MVGIVGLLLGGFCILAGVFDWDWVFSGFSKRSSWMKFINRVGRKAARIYSIVLGIVLIVVGFGVGFGILK